MYINPLVKKGPVFTLVACRGPDDKKSLPEQSSLVDGGNLYRFLFETSPDPIVICDGNGKVTLADARRFTKNGDILDVQISATLLKNNGEISGNMVILRDVTSHKKMEVELEESKRRMTDIINFLPDATMVIDRNGKVIAWNHAIEEMTGMKAEDMLGKGNYEYTLPFYGERRPILVDLVLLPCEEFEKKYTHIQRMGKILFSESYTPSLKSGAPSLCHGVTFARHQWERDRRNRGNPRQYGAQTKPGRTGAALS